MSEKYVLFFSEIGINDVERVGGKNASLGEMYRALSPLGIRIPNGFALTAEAYRQTLSESGAWDRLAEILANVDVNDVSELSRSAASARDLITSCRLPDAVIVELQAAIRKLSAEYGPELSVAVRSSATAEDLPGASFAGQHESYLNVSGDDAIMLAIQRCYASLFTERAIRYRVDHGFDHLKVFNSVGVMKMVRSDLASSGVIFTLDTESGFSDVVFITGAFGLGETIVQGAVDPDEFYVFKPTFRQGRKCILRRTLGSKDIKLVYAHPGLEQTTRSVPVEEPDRKRFCISEEEVLELADQALKIEDHFSGEAGTWRPMDIEWAKDGVDGLLYLVQARPETVASRKNRSMLTTFRLREHPAARVTGHAVGSRIATGRARVISHEQGLETFVQGEVLIADTTSPDWGTVMKRAAAIVTNRGGRTCHAAIVARESDIPAVVGAENATQNIRTGDLVTVCCAEGDIGHVYDGALRYDVEETDLAAIPRPNTKILLNVGDPDRAFALAALPNDGVGLARMEFVISEFIQIHPMALVHPERVAEPDDRKKIQEITTGYSDPRHFFVERLSEGVGTIAAAFFPKPVVVRMSDFKTNEYASLIGGRSFEPVETNPMIGFRGASRYTHPAYAEAFALECAAMKRARSELGLSNIVLMIPFCRRVDEAEKVVAEMKRHGLDRGQDGLKIYVMCEIPNNVILVDEFSKHFDGFSIGSNDLTQLTLGVDRDSEIVAFDFDERDAGVKRMIQMAIEGAHRNGRHCGICGQAPSDYPEMAEFLVQQGIDSISLNPDSILKTTLHILDVEKKLRSL